MRLQRWENGPYFADFSLPIPDVRSFSYVCEIVKICPPPPIVSINLVFRGRTPKSGRLLARQRNGGPDRLRSVCYTRKRETGGQLDTKVFDEISRRVQESIANTPVEDVQKNLRALMSGWFARLDLVTREEFDAQQAVLQRTREKLSSMEGRVAELEQLINGRNDG